MFAAKMDLKKNIEKVHLLDILPAEFYSTSYIPLVRQYTDNEERPNEDKIGGNMPFFTKGETWPTSDYDNPFTFVCQLTVPEEANLPYAGKTVRLFMDPDEDEPVIHISFIDYSQDYIEMTAPPSVKHYKCFKVLDYQKHKELNHTFNDDDKHLMARVCGVLAVRHWYGAYADDIPEPAFADADAHERELHCQRLNFMANHEDYTWDSFKADFLNPPSEVIATRYIGIKFGGCPTSCQGVEQYYIDNDQFFQIGKCDALDWYYGDSGEIHINPLDGSVDGDCC